MSPAPGRLDPDELAGLEEQRDFLLRSLEDLEREHDAGDLDDTDFAELRDDYTARAAETLRAIDEQRAAFADARGKKTLGRTLAVFGGVIVFAIVAGLLVANSIGARKAGDTISGGIDTAQSPSQQAQACINKMQADLSGALDCFKGVLDQDPKNAVALTWLGWTLELSSAQLPEDQAAALSTSAKDLLERAVEANPDYSIARAFRAILAVRRGDFVDAKRYLADFEARKPSSEAAGIIEQFDIEGQIEKGLAEGATTTTAPGAPGTTAPG
ncbi:hypothetical protein BH10ACT1_BH10ACT1_15520 [soil metagenome]